MKFAQPDALPAKVQRGCGVDRPRGVALARPPRGPRAASRPRRGTMQPQPRQGIRPRLDLEDICRRTEAGQTLVEIANAIGASSTGVQRAMVRAGIPRRPKGDIGRNPRLDVEEIRRRHEMGESVAVIARAIGASEMGVEKVVQRFGIPRGPSG